MISTLRFAICFLPIITLSTRVSTQPPDRIQLALVIPLRVDSRQGTLFSFPPPPYSLTPPQNIN